MSIATDRAQKWINDKNIDEIDRNEIKKLINENNLKEIEERFYKDLEFGTGGIRSVMGMGINRINKYTISQATQALANVILEDATIKNNPLNAKVAISYDSRNNSFLFAKVAAGVLAANGIQAFIYRRLNPVCLLSFAVRELNAIAGIMITASHNPPDNNGYKVYWSDGCQVTAPNDQNIINAFYAIDSYSMIKSITFEEGIKKGLINYLEEEMEDKYIDKIARKTIRPTLCKEHGNRIKFVYTPIHGSGLIPCMKIFKKIGLTNFSVVEEQREPNGNFPTVKSPNPENQEALKMAETLMDKEHADIAFGSDPDADRIGIIVKHKNSKIFLSGNQIGTLLLYYVLDGLKEKNELPKNGYVIKSIVTTELQQIVANHYNIKMENTLTGFKWICGRIREIEQSDPNRIFLFGTEESFGYLNHAEVRDKDGIAPLALITEMALYYKLQNKTLVDAMNEIYKKFGYHHETLVNLNYHGKEGAEKIKRIMEQFRNYKEEKILDYKIKSVNDYQNHTITDYKTKQIIGKLDLPKSNVLCFNFENDYKLFLRPSGTEPKIKFYLMLTKKEDSKKSIEMLEDICNIEASSIVEFIKNFADRI